MPELKISSLNKKQFAEVANMKPVAPEKKGTFKQEMVKSINNIQKPIIFGQNPNSISNKLGQVLSLTNDKTGQGYSITPTTTTKQTAINYAGGKVAGKLLGAAAKTPAAKKVVEYLTTKTPLKNAYKLNPFAKKPSPNKFYRTLGDGGLKDALKTKTLRANPAGDGTMSNTTINLSRPSDVPYFAKGEIGNYPGNNIVAEVSKPLFKRGDLNPVTKLPIKGRHWGYRNIDETGKAANVPLEEVKLLKKHWLKGYKEIPKMKKGTKKLKYSTGVQQIYNDTPDYSKIQNRRAERDALENTGLSVANEFGGQYKSLAQGGNLLGKAIEGNGNNKGKAIAGKAVSYGSTGAAVGMQVGGPIGGAIGAGVGLIGGGTIGAINYDKDRQLKLQADKLAYKTNANKKFSEGSSTDAQSFLAKKGKYKVKGRVIETEGREPIFSPKKADGTRDLLYFNPQAPTHAEGGVKMAVVPKGKTKYKCGTKDMKYGNGTKKIVGDTTKPKVNIPIIKQDTLFSPDLAPDLELEGLSKKKPKNQEESTTTKKDSGKFWNNKKMKFGNGTKKLKAPIQTTDKTKVQAYNDSLEAYKSTDYFRQIYTDSPGKLSFGKPFNKVEKVYKEYLWQNQNPKSKIQPNEAINYVGGKRKDGSIVESYSAFPLYKKPEQPYILKKQTPKDNYQTWKSKLPKNLQYEGDYDLKGFYKENPNFSAKKGEHMTDKFKLPNHPTFSNESKYYREGMKAGKWEGDKYIPIPAIEKMSGKTPTLQTSELPVNTPKTVNTTSIKKGGKFAQYPTMKKQLRYKQSASRTVNAKPVTNIVNTFAKGTSKLKVADPPPSAVFDNTYLGDDGSFQLSPEDINTPSNKLRKKMNNPNHQKTEVSEVPTYYPSSLEWTKTVKRLDKNGNETNTSLMQDLNNPVHVMYHKNGKANFVYLRGEEDKQAAVNRALVETFGPSSAKQRESGTALFDEETEKKIIEDYKKRNGYTEESFTYKKGVSKMKYKKGTKAIQYENTIPEGSSIVTAEGGMNKAALIAYQNKDWNTLDRIINSMPEDKNGKKVRGTDFIDSTRPGRAKGYKTKRSATEQRSMEMLYDKDPVAFKTKYGKFASGLQEGRVNAQAAGQSTFNYKGKPYQSGVTPEKIVGKTYTPAPLPMGKPKMISQEQIDDMTKKDLSKIPDGNKGFDMSSIPSIAEITARQSILNKGVDPVQENYLKLGRYKYASQLPKNLQENMMATNTAKSTVKNVSAGNIGNYLSNVGNLTTSRLRANNDAVIADTLGRQEILNKNVDLGNTEVQTNLGLKNQYNDMKAQNLGAYNNQIITQGQSIDSTIDATKDSIEQKKTNATLLNLLKTGNYKMGADGNISLAKKGKKNLKYKTTKR